MPKSTTMRTVVASFLFFVFGSVNAAVISPGTPTTSVPTSLVDSLATLSSPLPPGEYLLPVEITGANGLQDWSFDLLFDSNVVNPFDAGGLSGSVYPAVFNVTDPTPSGITSAGFPFTDLLQGIAGFSSGVSGDGLLAYVLFELNPNNPDADIQDAGFRIENATIQQAPEPTTLALLAIGLLAFGVRRKTALAWRIAT